MSPSKRSRSRAPWAAQPAQKGATGRRQRHRSGIGLPREEAGHAARRRRRADDRAIRTVGRPNGGADACRKARKDARRGKAGARRQDRNDRSGGARAEPQPTPRGAAATTARDRSAVRERRAAGTDRRATNPAGAAAGSGELGRRAARRDKAVQRHPGPRCDLPKKRHPDRVHRRRTFACRFDRHCVVKPRPWSGVQHVELGPDARA